MEGTRRSEVAANGARLRNSQMQALFIANEERLRSLGSFAADKGPELVGDLFSPWVKWSFILVKYFLESDEDAKLFVSRIFGSSSPRSPLQIVISTFRSASEEVLHDAEKMACVSATALVPSCFMILMLLTVIGDFGWKWLIGIHLGLFVAQTNLLQLVTDQRFSDKEMRDLVFQAVHVCLYSLDAIGVTPPTLTYRFLLHLVSPVCVFLLQFPYETSMEPLLCMPCIAVMLFYIPLWLVFILSCMISACILAYAEPEDIIPVGICVCVTRGLVYVSDGGFCGALFLFLCSIVLVCVDTSTALEMVIPLPLVCALLSCFYTPFWVGLCCTSTFICALAAANNKVEAILWWFVSFAALHSLSYAFSPNFSVLAMCFLGSYFSYGCIL